MLLRPQGALTTTENMGCNQYVHMSGSIQLWPVISQSQHICPKSVDAQCDPLKAEIDIPLLCL